MIVAHNNLICTNINILKEKLNDSKINFLSDYDDDDDDCYCVT